MEFDWDILGNNLYDEKIKTWLESHDRTISDYKLEKNLDLTVTFDDGDVLEIFINTTTTTECWRFFECNSHDHVVVSGKDVLIGDEVVYALE